MKKSHIKTNSVTDLNQTHNCMLMQRMSSSFFNYFLVHYFVIISYFLSHSVINLLITVLDKVLDNFFTIKFKSSLQLCLV